MALTPNNDNIQTDAPKHIDNRYGPIENGMTVPFSSVAAALASEKLNPYLRFVGATHLVMVNGIQREYWFKDGVEDVNFVLKGFEVSDVPLPTPSDETFIII